MLSSLTCYIFILHPVITKKKKSILENILSKINFKKTLEKLTLDKCCSLKEVGRVLGGYVGK